MTRKLFRCAALMAFCSLFFYGHCGKVENPIPQISDATYELPLTMKYNSVGLRYLVSFGGKLPYSYPPCKDEVFSFTDHPKQPAQLEVWTSDTAGLQPGERFEYSLVFDRPGGFTQETFKLIAFNPLAGPPRQYDFKYVVLSNQSDPNLLWQHTGVAL